MKKIITIATILILFSCKKTEHLPIRINYDYILIEVITESKDTCFITTSKNDTKYYSNGNGYLNALVRLAPLDSFKYVIKGTDYNFAIRKNDSTLVRHGAFTGVYTFDDWFYNN